MQVGDIMTSDVKTAETTASLSEAAKILHQNKISSVIITEAGRIAGIVTERDLVNVVAEGLDPGQTTVGTRMTREHLRISASSGSPLALPKGSPCVLDLPGFARPRAHAAAESTI